MARVQEVEGARLRQRTMAARRWCLERGACGAEDKVDGGAGLRQRARTV